MPTNVNRRKAWLGQRAPACRGRQPQPAETQPAETQFGEPRVRELQPGRRRSEKRRVPVSVRWSTLVVLLVVVAGHRVGCETADAWDDNAAQSRPPVVGEDLGSIVGEDLGSKREDPLQQIHASMGEVQVRLHDGDTSQATLALQRSIVEGLSKLIEQQSQSTSQQSAAGNQEEQQTRPDAGERPGGTAGGQGTTPSSSGGLGKTDGLFRQIWGHLPDQVRQQMETPLHEKFLPQYDDVIQNYFKQLADDNSK